MGAYVGTTQHEKGSDAAAVASEYMEGVATAHGRAFVFRASAVESAVVSSR
jgi:hypothetical protein